LQAWHDILIKRSLDQGNAWSNATVVYSESGGWGKAAGAANSTIGNGELVVDRISGEIFVFMCRNNSQILLASSTDDGVTFAMAKDVSRQVKPDSLQWGWYATSFSSVQLKFNKQHQGRLVACADHVLHGFTAYPIENSHSHTIISDNHGRDWRVGKTVLALNTSNECSLAELSNGTVVMNSRNYVGQSKDTVHRFISHSTDGGDSFPVGWFAEDLPDPIVFSDLTSTTDGNTLLLTHPNSQSTRRNVSLFTSANGGASWALAVQLETGPSQYSSVVMLPNGSVAVQSDAGCQGHKPSEYGVKACDKAAPQQEDFFIVNL
jgi:sialidase-1